MNSYLLIASGNAPLRNGDVHYPFRVDSDFLAWTGMDIEGAILLHNLRTKEQVLFFDEPDEKKRLWESTKWDISTIHAYGFAGEIHTRMELRDYLEQLEGYFFLPEKAATSIEKEYVLIREILSGKIVASADRYLTQKRLFKSDDDIEKIRKVIEITGKTYDYITQNIRPGMYEYEIEAMIAYQFRLHHGVEAFPSIVASGSNACILHYTANNRQIKNGDLLLIDFGIELDGYGADISRTFAVGGVMNSRQQDIYRAVLDVKEFAESVLKPGITRRNWNIEVKEYMFTVCQRLGFPNIEKYTMLTNPYFPHSIGHFLGLDTHDVGDSDIPLMPGMILTCEPGIYIREEGIGIRIEDDILITSDGCINLSKKIPIILEK